jgi:hypothetical protein
MKDQLITILEAVRLSRSVLARQSLPGGPSVDSAIQEIRRLLDNRNVDQAIDVLDPDIEASGIAPTDGEESVRAKHSGERPAN